MKKEKQEKKVFTVLIVCIVVMALIFGWMSKDLGGSNQYIDKNSKQSLSELMEQMERAYRNRLEITYEQIDSIEKYMFGDGEREAELKDYQNYFDSMESNMVRDIVFVNDEGEYLCMRGLNGRIQMQDGLSELFGENKGIAQYCTWKDGEEIFIIAKSVDSFLVNGEEYEAIAFLFRPQIINDLFVTSAYNGQANIYVMDENGEVAYASINNEPGEVTINYNLFDSYHEQKIMNKKDYEKVKSDYAERSSGCITLERENESDYFSYRALKGTQYMIACEVDSTIVQNVLADYQIMMLHIWLTVTCIIIAMLAALGISILWIYNEKNKVAYARRNAMQQAEAAEKLEEVNTALEETVQFANTAKAEAERANEAKSVFLSNMSHDMRTPLNAVMGLATLISRDAENSDCVREYARKLTYSGEHLLGLINDVLDMSKIEAGKTVLNITNTNIAELVEELDMIIRSQTREKGQEFMIHVHRIETEEVEADKLRLKQILLNILSNAVKYTPKGGKIVFDITEVPKKKGNFAQYQFRISDNGQGMGEEYLKNLFDPFSREVQSTVNPVSGTCLGMPIAKSLVELMGGSIHVESKLGKGTTFEVILNFRKIKYQEKVNWWKLQKISQVLVVDDESESGRYIMDTLHPFGIDVQTADSGEMAVHMAEQMVETGQTKSWDVVIIDWKMPGMDGVTTAEKLHQILGEKTVLLLFAYDCKEIEEAAGYAGIQSILSKPFFVTNFKRCIEQARKEQQLQGKGQATEKEKMTLKGMRFLIADDNDLNAEILEELLKMEGADCDRAVNGKEAVEMFARAEEGRYNIILMDIKMPVMNGYDATKEIRRLEKKEAAKIPIFAMTANAFAEDIRTCMEAGMDAHIAKPVDLDLLEENIRIYMQAKA